MECEYCGNSFSTKMSLHNHQKRTKYCIKIQQKKNDELPLETMFCKWCEKQYFRKDHLKTHENICTKGEIDVRKVPISKKDKLLQIIAEKDEIIYTKNELINELKIKNAELSALLKKETEMKDEFKQLHGKREECIEKIAMQPKVTTQNNTQNNILNQLPPLIITSEQLQVEADQHFSKELFLKGQAGAADFFTEVVKRQTNGIIPWMITDKARAVFKYKDGNKEVITDHKGEKISLMVAEAIKKKNKEHHDSFYPEEYDSDVERDEDQEERRQSQQQRADNSFIELSKLNRDNKVFRKRIIETCS